MTTVRLARQRDVEALPDIEQSAGEAYRQIPELAWIADDEDLTVERYRELVRNGVCWVAVDEDGRLVGFLSAEIHDETLHIWEIAVRLHNQRKGIGRALIARAVEDATARRLTAITLTTFIDVAWNAPFYQKLGFQVLDDTQSENRLRQILHREIKQGMTASRRCAMRLTLDPTIE